LAFRHCNIELTHIERRKVIDIQHDQNIQTLYIYHDNERITGFVNIWVEPGSVVYYQNIYIQFIGEIGWFLKIENLILMNIRNDHRSRSI